MDLKARLRQDRAWGRVKEPFSPSFFSHLGGLVRRYRLGEDFARLAGSLTPLQVEVVARKSHNDAKPAYRAPLFFLASPEEYRVIEKILAGLDNPYIVFAHCPEEILLSRTLWEKRPGLAPEELLSRHLAALW